MASIKLTDGTIMHNLTINGDNFIANYEVDPDIFNGNLTNVEITIDGDTQIHSQMKCIQVTNYGNEYWFVLIDLTEQEILNLEIEAKIDYLAMMADIDIDA